MRMFQSVIVFGIATVVFGVSTDLWLSMAALVIMGAADQISVVIRLSLVQLATPDDMRGRVSAVNFLFVNASNQLGEFESGVTAAWWGAVPAVHCRRRGQHCRSRCCGCACSPRCAMSRSCRRIRRTCLFQQRGVFEHVRSRCNG